MMPDGLRDRIADVLARDAFGLTTRTAALRQADAVIDALNLQPEQRQRHPKKRDPTWMVTETRHTTGWEITGWKTLKESTADA